MNSVCSTSTFLIQLLSYHGAAWSLALEQRCVTFRVLLRRVLAVPVEKLCLTPRHWHADSLHSMRCYAILHLGKWKSTRPISYERLWPRVRSPWLFPLLLGLCPTRHLLLEIRLAKLR